MSNPDKSTMWFCKLAPEMFVPSQVLPNASEETVAQLEANLAALPPISQLLQDGDSAADITARILGPLGVQQESATSITPR